jgi:hypothetical protein
MSPQRSRYDSGIRCRRLTPEALVDQRHPKAQHREPFRVDRYTADQEVKSLTAKLRDGVDSPALVASVFDVIKRAPAPDRVAVQVRGGGR